LLVLERVDLGSGVGAWFTGRDPDAADPPVGAAGNLAHRRPHRPADLAAARSELARRTDTDAAAFHLLQQVHGAEVAVVDAATPTGAELAAVDAAVTDLPDTPLLVQVADCVPVLLAGPTAGGRVAVGVAHAGRAGVLHGVVAAAVTGLAELGAAPAAVMAAIGPAIGGCCYELPAATVEELGRDHPDAVATTTWGTPSVDLPTAVGDQLAAAGVGTVQRLAGCTRCDATQRWFSHRRDATTGRQVGLVVARGAGA
jgi:YfiH family protein